MILIFITICAYFLAFSLLIAYLVNPTHLQKIICFSVLATSIVAHAAVLYGAIDIGQSQNLSPSNMLSMIIWEAALICWVAALKMKVLDFFLLINPLAIFSLFIIYLAPGYAFIHTQNNLALFFHIMLSVMTFSFFALAFIQSVFRMILHYLLRSKRALLIGKSFPPLEMMDRLLLVFIYLGFLMLTLSLISVFFEVEWAQLTRVLCYKLVLALAAWCTFGMVILFRYQRGWHGMRLAVSAMLGNVVLLLSYVGTSLL